MTNYWHASQLKFYALALCSLAGTTAAADQPKPIDSDESMRGGFIHRLSVATGVTIGDIRYSVAVATPDPNLESALLDQLVDYEYCDDNPSSGIRYFYNLVDLNGDSKLETLVYLVGGDTCGSAGCTAFVFENVNEALLLKSRLAPVNNPIVVSDWTSNRWRDLIVYVTGGGATPAYHILRHSESAYPQKPSIAPTVEEGTVIAGNAYIANEISFDTQAPVLRSRGCAAAEFDVLRSESFGDLRFGMSGDQVLASLGNPQFKGDAAMSEADPRFHQTWRYPDVDVVLDMVSTLAGGRQEIGSIQIGATSKLKTRRGIGVGDTYAEVAEAYDIDRDQKAPSSPSTLVVGSVYGGLVFTFDVNGRVDRVLLGAKAE